MTVPVTGSTPTYGLEYPLEGEPAWHIRQKWARMVAQVEAGLIAQGVPPPGSSDLAALTGRVNVLEARCKLFPLTANTAAGTTEFEVLRISNEPVVAGARYRVRFGGHLIATVVSDRCTFQLRSGLGLTGAVISGRNFIAPSPAATPFYVEPTFQWTAPAGTTSQSFTLTLQRSGTGTVRTEVVAPAGGWVEFERTA